MTKAEYSTQYLVYIVSIQPNSIPHFTNIVPEISTWLLLNPVPNIWHAFFGREHDSITSSTIITPAIPTCQMPHLLPNISHNYLGEWHNSMTQFTINVTFEIFIQNSVHNISYNFALGNNCITQFTVVLQALPLQFSLGNAIWLPDLVFPTKITALQQSSPKL